MRCAARAPGSAPDATSSCRIQPWLVAFLPSAAQPGAGPRHASYSVTRCSRRFLRSVSRIRAAFVGTGSYVWTRWPWVAAAAVYMPILPPMSTSKLGRCCRIVVRIAATLSHSKQPFVWMSPLTMVSTVVGCVQCDHARFATRAVAHTHGAVADI